MKTINKILLVTAAAASFTFVNSASADENTDPNLLQNSPMGSPRQAELMQSTAMAPNDNSNQDPDLLKYNLNFIGTPKMVQLAQENATTGNYNNQQDPNLVAEYSAVAGTPKEKDSALQDFEIAPLK